jgi:hypothetical protein
MLLTATAVGRRPDVSGWGRAAAIATLVSAFAYALQSILDYVPAPHSLKFAEFWGLFAGSAVVGFLAGLVAVVYGRKAGGWNPTVVCGLAGIGWLVLAQGIQLVWN